MQISRQIIETSTQIICYLKRNRKVGTYNFPDIVKINLGCGLAVAKGWLNIDGSLNAMIASWPKIVHRLMYRLSGANRYYTSEQYCSLLEEHDFIHADLSHGIPFADGSVDFVYSSHFLEHLYRTDAIRLLKESFRVLKPGGIMRVAVPDLAYAILLYGKGEKEKMLNNYFFVEDKESSFARHKYMYDFELLRDMLKEVGFTYIVQCSYQQGKTPDIDILDNRVEDTLFIEAGK